MPRTKIKNTVLAKAYIKNGMNGAKTIREFKPHLTPQSSKVRASEMLHNKGFQVALKEEMENKGITSERISNLIKRNMDQENNLPASNNAIDMAIKIRGDYAAEKKINLNINISDKELDKAIEDKYKEIKLLDSGTVSNE